MVGPVQILQHDEQASRMRRGGKRIDGGRRGTEPDRSQVIGPSAARILGQPVSLAGAASGVQYPPPWPQRRCTPLFDGPAPQHPRPGPPRTVGQFFRQPRLADPRRPGQHDEPAVTGQRLGQPPPQRGQLPVTPGQDARAWRHISHAAMFPRRAPAVHDLSGWHR